MKKRNIEKKIYEILGVNFFRKYILFSWEKLCKLVNFDPCYRLDKKTLGGLKQYKSTCEVFAITHTTCLIVTCILCLIASVSIIYWINIILLHGYCIMTQRYNIIRINEVIEKYEKLEKKKIEKLIDNNNKIIENISEMRNKLKPSNENKYLEDFCIPVINDDVISLSVSNKVSANEINDRSFENFDVILNATNERIGSISFDYHIPKPDFGNVTYHIKEPFQNNGYASRVLKLLVKLLKNNNFKGDKDLYFLVSYYNEYSKKVVLNNGGEIVNGGDTEAKTPYTLRIKI